MAVKSPFFGFGPGWWWGVVGMQAGQSTLVLERVSRLRLGIWFVDGDIASLSRAGLHIQSLCPAGLSLLIDKFAVNIWSKIPREIERRTA